MATYTVHNYNAPSSRKDAYKDYMPNYRTYSYTRPKDTYSDFDSPYASDILQAQSQLDRVEENKPKAYDSAYSNRINQLINQMANRKFSYDINGDALYQQYKKQYMEQGKQAMQDTMGQAAALTGGYGNSYASSVGNQAYQSYLGQLNDRIPELYQLALDRYNTEGADMQTLYSMMSDQEAQDYGKYRDSVADYQTDRGYYDTRLQNLRTMGQNLWGQNWDNYLNVQQMNDTNYQNAVNTALSLLANDWDNYHWAKEQTQRNYEQAVAEDQWNANFNENQRQFNESQAQAAAELAYQREKAALAGTGSSSSAADGSKSSNNNTVSDYAYSVLNNIENTPVPNDYKKSLIDAEYDRGNITKYERDQLKKYFS